MDKQFFKQQLAKWRKEEKDCREIAELTKDEDCRKFYTSRAARAAAYAADYEQDLAK
jgi:capsular polysaccharide biosynthesis protein